jgi:phosphomevalonate kinase
VNETGTTIVIVIANVKEKEKENTTENIEKEIDAMKSRIPIMTGSRLIEIHAILEIQETRIIIEIGNTETHETLAIRETFEILETCETRAIHHEIHEIHEIHETRETYGIRETFTTESEGIHGLRDVPKLDPKIDLIAGQSERNCHQRYPRPK